MNDIDKNICEYEHVHDEVVEQVSVDMPDEDLLYDDRATRADLLDLLRQTPKDVDEVLVVGHLIPPLAALAASLADASVSDDDSLKDMGKKFPTAAVAVLELPENTDFADLADGSCRLTRFIRPKDLK